MIAEANTIQALAWVAGAARWNPGEAGFRLVFPHLVPIFLKVLGLQREIPSFETEIPKR